MVTVKLVSVIKNHTAWLPNCVRPRCDNLAIGIRGASSSTFVSEVALVPTQALLLLGT